MRGNFTTFEARTGTRTLAARVQPGASEAEDRSHSVFQETSAGIPDTPRAPPPVPRGDGRVITGLPRAHKFSAALGGITLLSHM